MAAFVVYENGRSIEWHVGEAPLPVDVSKVEEVQADGDELKYILAITATSEGTYSIPFSAVTSIHRWFGDIAKFIVWNVLK